MSEASTIGQRAQDVARRALECADSGDADACERLHLEIGMLESAARELFQAALQRDLFSIVDKLERGAGLEASELESLKRLLAGVSRHYLASENDVQSWRNEIRRLAGELEAASGSADGDLEALINIQSLCREALRVVPDLQYYLGEGARIARLEKSAEVIDREEGKMLARVIREMMASPDR